jgi:hypothetical protein
VSSCLDPDRSDAASFQRGASDEDTTGGDQRCPDAVGIDQRAPDDCAETDGDRSGYRVDGDHARQLVIGYDALQDGVPAGVEHRYERSAESKHHQHWRDR